MADLLCRVVLLLVGRAVGGQKNSEHTAARGLLNSHTTKQAPHDCQATLDVGLLPQRRHNVEESASLFQPSWQLPAVHPMRWRLCAASIHLAALCCTLCRAVAPVTLVSTLLLLLVVLLIMAAP